MIRHRDQAKPEPLVLLEVLLKRHYEVGAELQNLLNTLKGRSNDNQQ